MGYKDGVYSIWERKLTIERYYQMPEALIDNIDKVHTTEMGQVRIKQNLNLKIDDVVNWCKQAITEATKINREGKNWYVEFDNAVITINAHSYTIITAHKN